MTLLISSNKPNSYGNVAACGEVGTVDELKSALDSARVKRCSAIALKPGRFVLPDVGGNNSGLVLPHGVQLIGSGAERTTISIANGAEGHIINAPYGGVTVSELTIDGNRKGRGNVRASHNLRVEGESITIKGVSSVEAVSYGIAIGQRRFARDILLDHVAVTNCGGDGIDIKNRLGRTEVSIRNVRVENFGLSACAGKCDRSQFPAGDSKAGIDLRGRCDLESVHVAGIGEFHHGLRFRHGERGSPNGPGAHGSSAAGVVIRNSVSQRGSAGMSVNARNIKIDGFEIDGCAAGLIVREDLLEIENGWIASPETSILMRPIGEASAVKAEFRSVVFNPAHLSLSQGARATFIDCHFASCSRELTETEGVVEFVSCQFDNSCNR